MRKITTGLTSANYIAALSDNKKALAIIYNVDPGILIDVATSDGVELIAALNSNLGCSDFYVGMKASTFINIINQKYKAKTSIINPYIVPNSEGSETMLVNSFYQPSILKMSNGNTLISCMKRGGTTLSRQNFTIILDTSNDFSIPNLIPHDIATEGTYDSHGRACFIEKDNIIYGFHEKLNGVSPNTSAGHDSWIIVIKSTDFGVTWTEITRVEFVLCYPQAFIIGNDLYFFARESISGQSKTVSLFKSANDGVTWTKTSPYVGADGYWSYPQMPEGNNNEINIIITERITTGTYFNYPSVLHIRSTDGITYYNTDRTWSKNIVNDGGITRTEALANCLIGTYTSNTVTAYYGGSFIKNDKLYTLIGYGNVANFDGDGISKTTYTSGFIYEGKTQLIDITSLINGYVSMPFLQTMMRLVRNGTDFDILRENFYSNYDLELIKYNVNGLISTELLRVGTNYEWGYQFAGVSYNLIDGTDKKLIISKLTGTVFDLLTSHSDFFVLNATN